jgi:tetratricopeptide (TPR) repeat protein
MLFAVRPKITNGWLRFSMKEPQPCKLHESDFLFGTPPAVGANGGGRLFVRRLVLVLALLAGSVAAMTAQTSASRAAGVRDHLRKAEEYLKANDSSSAVKELEAVLALDPNNGEAYTNLGVIAFFQRDYQNSSRYLRKALAIDPSSARTQALLGVCQKRLGNPSARELLEKSFPKLKDKALRLQVGMELAAVYDQQGDPGATASVMRSLVDLDPDNVDVLFMAQRVYSELAEDTMNKLAVLAPGSSRMQQVIAQSLINAGDLNAAMDHYRKALQIDPRLPGVHFELAEAILESSPSDAGAQSEAQKELQVAVTTDGDTAKTECEFGRIASLQGRPKEAFAHYQRAYELNPNETQAQLGMARLLMLQEKPQEAIKYLHMAVQSDPLNSEAHYRLAVVCRALNLADQAKKEMQLFQDIKKTKDQVEDLYRQMNRQRRVPADEVPENAPAETEH